MQDLPQQPPDFEVVISVEEQDSECFEVIQDDLSFEVIEKPILPVTKLEEKDLFNVARYLHAHYSKGFTWSELPNLIQDILSFISPNPEMNLKEKQKATILTLHYVMVSMHPAYLPEKVTHPFFEELLPHFIELALKFPQEKKAIQPSRTDLLTETSLSEYSEHIAALFDDGLTWKNLATATRYALTYILSYAHLSSKDQQDGAFAILEILIASADSSELPPHFDPKLFKEFLSGYLKNLLT